MSVLSSRSPSRLSSGNQPRRPLASLFATLLAVLLGLTVLHAPSGPANAMTQAEANALLRSNERIQQGLLAAAILEHIVENCESLDGPSPLFVTSYMLGLYNQARRLGPSRAQVFTYFEDEQERALVYDQAFDYIRSTGATPHDPQSLCALGHGEIRARTEIGRRLRER